MNQKRLCYYYRDLNKKYSLYAFLLAFLIASILVVPVMIYDKGYFLYYGDFNVQQIPFYRLAHDSILSGNVKWSSLTDLGANFIGSYSFYLLGSPFFWITLLLPSNLVAYSMGPLLILKLSLASLTAYIYLKRYLSNKKLAVLGGILYAFSGFSIYNIFFFHFHEAIIIFPLLLAAVDEYMETERKGVVAIAVFASAFINYYFFVGQVIFIIIYWVINVISKTYTVTLKKFLILAFECIVGFLMAAVLLLPSVLAIMGNYRLSEYCLGWDGIVYTPSQRYIHILSSFFFPPDIPARPNFTPDSNAKWASVAAFLPLFSMTFVIAYVQGRKKSPLKRLFITLIIFTFIPILNSSFQMLNSAFYTRWYYMLTLVMVLMTVYSIEHIGEVDFEKAFRYVMVISIAIVILIGFMPTITFSNSDITSVKFGLEKYPDRFWTYAILTLLGVSLTGLAVSFLKHRPKVLIEVLCGMLAVFIVTYSGYIIYLSKTTNSYSDEDIIYSALNGGEDITLSDIKDVRSDFYRSMDNIGMYWQVPNIQAFHSIVPSSLMDFYNTIGIQRDVGSRPSTDFYGVRGLLSVKYLFEPYTGSSFVNSDGETLIPGFKQIGCENRYNEYENEYYIPMGFTYDKFICEEEFKNLSDKVMHQALLKSMVLTQDQMEKYRDITGYQDGMYLSLTFDENNPQDKDYPTYSGFESITSKFFYSEDEYKKDCEKLKENTCTEFSYNNDGFTATVYNSGDDNLLFFSVPYDKGFKAYVNDKEVEIEKVNIGFMAVKVDGHTTSKIKFVYETPGLKIGAFISLGAVLIFAVYLIINKGFSAKKKHRRIYKIKQITNNGGQK